LIPVPSAVRVWLAVGHTDMRRGMNGLALQVQQALQRDPHAGDLYVFRGKRGDLVKILWHDGMGMSLYAKRLERGRFIWPTPTQGVVSISAAQFGYMLDGIDWRNPQHTWRPQAAGWGRRADCQNTADMHSAVPDAVPGVLESGCANRLYPCCQRRRHPPLSTPVEN
jgi:transposase